MTDQAPPEPDFRITVTRGDVGAIVAAAGELDLATASTFAATLRDQLAAGPALLDLSELSFMDSSGVRALDDLMRDVDRERWTLELRPDLHDHVRQVLSMTGLLERLPFARPREGAGG